MKLLLTALIAITLVFPAPLCAQWFPVFSGTYTITGGSAPTFVASIDGVGAGGWPHSFTTTSIDTTGATATFVAVTYYNAGTFTSVADNKGNAYTLVRSTAGVDSNVVALWKCDSATTGSGHTFTINGSDIYSNIHAAAFSGINAASADGDNSTTTNTVTTHQPGSVTTTTNGDLLLIVSATNPAKNTAVTGFSTLASVSVIEISYAVQTTAGAINPTVTWDGASVDSCTIISAHKR